MAVGSVSFLARGKADTRARKDTEPTAGHAAPELVPAVGGNYARRKRRRPARWMAPTIPNITVTCGWIPPFADRRIRHRTQICARL